MKSSAKSKWVLITGATSGIGYATALYLAEKKFNIIATGRNKQALAELDALAANKNLSLYTLELDVTDEENIATVRKEISAITKSRDANGIDVLVNNAGFGQAGFIADLSMDQIKRQFEVNVFGLLAVTKAFLPQLIQKQRSKIIIVGSIMGKMVAPWTGIYCTSKHAVKAISDVLRMELYRFNIQVALVEPGSIETSFHSETISSLDACELEQSPYTDVHEWMKAKDYAPFFAMKSIKPVVVSKLIHKLIRKRKMNYYYPVPFQARLLLWIYKYLPKKLLTKAMRRNFYLDKKIKF